MKAAVFVALLASAYAAEQLSLKPLKLKKKENTFCMDGRIAPQVFLAGYQKAGSSSLWTDLMRNFNLAAAHPIYKEEGFREKEVSFFHNEERYHKGHKFYLKHFPECKEYGANQKVIDGSPNAIYQTDTNMPIADVKIPAVPRMKKLYGDDLSKQLKFVIIVRDPANRMESSYYHFHDGKFGGFDGYVEKTLATAKNWTNGGETAPTPNLYWPSMYARHLKQWLAEFDPSQFAVVTLQQYKEKPTHTMEFISKRLGIEPRNALAKLPEVPATVENARNHKKMSSATRRKLEEFFAPMDKELADLVKEHQIGNSLTTGAKVPGAFLQTSDEAHDDEVVDNGQVHFMMPDLEDVLRKEYAGI